jgi:hypothetical protein
MALAQQTLAERSGGSATAVVVERAVELAFSQLRLGRQATPDQVEEVVRLLDAGELDAAIEANAPPVDPTQARRRYEDVEPFSHEGWKKRHGVVD